MFEIITSNNINKFYLKILLLIIKVVIIALIIIPLLKKNINELRNDKSKFIFIYNTI